jgi:hypothetical protein
MSPGRPAATLKEKNHMLTIEQIRHAFPSSAVDLPEFGTSALVKMLTGAVRTRIVEANTRKDGTMDVAGYSCGVLAATVCDADGNPMLTPEVAAELPSVIYDRLYQASAKLNGLLAAAVGDAEKNSEAAPSGDSPSDSPAT